MRDLTTLTYHPTCEKIVQLLCEKTQNSNPQFFRIMICYYICKMAASMRVKVKTLDRGDIPINFYGINLSVSGSGKGFSTNIIEDDIINKFRTIFFEHTLPKVAEKNLYKLAIHRANIKNANPNNSGVLVDPDEELIAVQKEYESLGKLAFSFDSATTAAVKQMRHKLLMAKIGAVNFECDEIGNNLLSNADVLSTFLELFDVGKVKQKLTKNTRDNIRSEEIDGKTPTNLMLFGTPIKLFDGSKTEEEFWSFIATGYGRRCFFGYTREVQRNKKRTAIDVYNSLTSKTSEQFLKDTANAFSKLAHDTFYDKRIFISKDVTLQLIEYKLHCEDTADALGEHEEMQKAELEHRYFKVLKLAGAFAFIDNQGEITEDNLYHAIAMAEESGKAFARMLNQDRNYVKLAKYIAIVNKELTHVDLTEALPFYKGAASQKADLMQLAIAWGYKHSIVIKRKIENNIEFVKGETLQKTDINNLTLSYSQEISDGYQNVRPAFKDLHQLFTLDSRNWCNHHVISDHRCEDSMQNGFDMVVLDVDGGTTIQQVQNLLQEYTYAIHTTKRHSEDENRFRVVLPINYKLYLNTDDFSEFMDNVYTWLPFNCDTATGQKSRKWTTCKNCQVFTNEGILVDALPFIPRTTKNEQYKEIVTAFGDMTNIERWFMSNTDIGNRNNKLIRYALMLVDNGYSLSDINFKIAALNAKLPEPLTEAEIENTIMKTTTKQYYKKGGA